MSEFIINKSIKLLVCDMAGTTVNEGGIVYKTLYNTIKEYGIKIDINDIDNFHGINKKEVLKHFIDKDINFRSKDNVLEDLISNFKSNLRNNYFRNDSISLIHPELPIFFNYLRENNIKIALNTGFPVDIQEEIINKLKMNDFIDDYISSEDVKMGRPHPYMINELMKRNNIKNPNEVIKIGDSTNDILEGKNAKCYKSIGVLSGAENSEKLSKIGADLVLNNIIKLKNYVKF